MELYQRASRWNSWKRRIGNAIFRTNRSVESGYAFSRFLRLWLASICVVDEVIARRWVSDLSKGAIVKEDVNI